MSRGLGPSLRTRVFLGSALLVALPVVAAIVAVTLIGGRMVDRAVESALSRGEAVQDHFRQWRASQLALMSRAVSSDPAFASYVAEAVARGAGTEAGVDSLSVADLLAERQDELGFDFAVVLDDEGHVMARTTEAIATGDDLAADPLVARALDELVPVTGLWRSRGRAHQVAIVPIARDGGLLGFLATGLAMDDRLALDIGRVSGCGVVFLAPTPSGELEVLSSSLDIDRSRKVGTLLAARPRLVEALAAGEKGAETVKLDVDGAPHVARLALLPDAAGAPVAVVASVDAVGPHAAAFRNIRSVVIVAGLLALLAGLALSFVLARRTLRPVAQLAESAEAAVAGDFTHGVDVPSDAELGAMARAFNALLRDVRERREMATFVSEISRFVPDPDLAARRSASEDTGPVGSATPTTPRRLPAARRGAGPTQPGDGPTRADLARAMDRLAPGAVLDNRYEILGTLGEGGMGVVYKAHDRELSEVVALKLLRPGAVATREHLERMKSEVRMARRITHPNVLRTHDVGEHEGRPYISMEYVRGVTLRDILSRSARLPEAPALRLLEETCDGLAVAHAAGILHRDMKPENVIIDPLGHARIMDFGLAAPLGEDDEEGRGSVFGTPLYLAPELLRGGAADVRSDVYAVGVILFELFTSHLPFAGRSIEELIAEKERGAPKPSRVRPGVPSGVDDLVAACLHPDPARRPPDATAVGRQVVRLRNDRAAPRSGGRGAA